MDEHKKFLADRLLSEERPVSKDYESWTPQWTDPHVCRSHIDF